MKEYSCVLYYEGIYKKGKKDGIWKGYYGENGKIYSECEYKDGNIIKNHKRYYENGIVKYEGELLNNVFHGKGKGYDELGRLVFEGEFKKGNSWNSIYKVYNNNGKLEKEMDTVKNIYTVY